MNAREKKEQQRRKQAQAQQRQWCLKHGGHVVGSIELRGKADSVYVTCFNCEEMGDWAEWFTEAPKGWNKHQAKEVLKAVKALLAAQITADPKRAHQEHLRIRRIKYFWRRTQAGFDCRNRLPT